MRAAIRNIINHHLTTIIPTLMVGTKSHPLPCVQAAVASSQKRLCTVFLAMAVTSTFSALTEHSIPEHAAACAFSATRDGDLLSNHGVSLKGTNHSHLPTDKTLNVFKAHFLVCK